MRKAREATRRESVPRGQTHTGDEAKAMSELMQNYGKQVYLPGNSIVVKAEIESVACKASRVTVDRAVERALDISEVRRLRACQEVLPRTRICQRGRVGDRGVLCWTEERGGAGLTQCRGHCRAS